MTDTRTEVQFFDYLENYYDKVNTTTKIKWKKSDSTIKDQEKNIEALISKIQTKNSVSLLDNSNKIKLDCTKNYSQNKKINVLTKEQQEEEFFIDLICKIEDSELRQKYVKKLKQLLVKKNNKPQFTKPVVNLSTTIDKFSKKQKKVTLSDLQHEVKIIKQDIIELKENDKKLNDNIIALKLNKNITEFEAKLDKRSLDKPPELNNEIFYKDKNHSDSDLEENNYHDCNPENNKLNIINKMDLVQKWHAKVKLVINDYEINVNALIDTGADLNCIQEGLIPTKYYHKTTEQLSSANGSKMSIKYKLPKVHVCQDKVCFKTSFVLVKNLTDNVILGVPFICLLYPFTTNSEGITTKPLGQQVTFKFLTKPEQRELKQLKEYSVSQSINIISQKTKQLKFLKEEIRYKRIEEQLTDKFLTRKIEIFKSKLEKEVCSNFPSAFWHRKKHIVTLPYIKDFSEQQIPTKSRPIQMNPEVMETCKKEINNLLDNNIIRKSKSPWSCPAFYVNKNAEIERGVPRLVINYKPLNTVLEWIRYPIPNKKDLINRLSEAVIFSKFDLKSGFWQIQLHPNDRYKTAFTTPFGHYEWNVMPFGLKNAPSEFQNIMNEIFNPFSHFVIVYIDDVLIFSKSIDEHWKHLYSFFDIIKHNGLVISAQKIKLFQTKIRFLGYDIYQATIVPISRAIQFADKFPDEITDKNQLQRFLGSLNYIAEFYKDLRKTCQPLFERLRDNPPPWSPIHTSVVKEVKKYVKTLPCLGIPTVNSFKIIQTDASDIGYGGILLQKVSSTSPEQIVRFHSGLWNKAQSNYSTIKKEILAIVLCISKFQDDILNQKFLVRVDCKSAKYVLEKDVKNIASKQIFARWQSILSIFDFNIEYIKGDQNSIPDFLTREFLFGKQ
jgi:hypothetical protein